MKVGLKLLLSSSVLLCAAMPAYAMDAETAKKFEQLMAVVEAQNAKIEALEKKLADMEKSEPPTKTEQSSLAQNKALDKVIALENRVEKQQILIEEQAETIAAVQSSKPDTFKGEGVTITRKDGAPVFDFGDGNTFQFHGRLQTDYAFFNEDDGVDLPNQGDIRRLRLGVKGTFAHDWVYAFFTDTNGGQPTVGDAWLAYNGFDNVSLKLGSQIELVTLEQNISNLNTAMLEHSIVHDAFFPGRNIGATAAYGGENWRLAAGVFGDGVNDGNETDETQHAFGTRATYAPINDDNQVLHLGASYRYAEPNAGDETVRFNARPGTRMSDGIRAADTGDIANVKSFDSAGLELAYTYDNYALQAEYIRAGVDRQGGSDLDFDGWYLQGSWFLTGEQRRYKVGSGGFSGIKVNDPLDQGGWGAWELAARYASLNLSDDDIDGGELDTIHMGVNWHPNNNVRFNLNYIINEIDDGPLNGQDIDAVVMRAQVDF